MTTTAVQPEEPPVRLSYQPALDGLRAVAVLAVMLFHAGLEFARGGFLGVDVFFVLSGYLITTLLVAEHAETGTISLGRFYVRRALRLFPALLVVVACIALIARQAIFPEQTAEIRREIATTLLYVANWAQAARIVEPLGVLSHTWSLAIEEQFYIVWPFVLRAMLASMSRSAVLWTIAAGAVASTILRAVLWEGPESFARVFHGSDTRADALLIGCFAALWTDGRNGLVGRFAFARRVPVFAPLVAALLLLGMFVVARTEATWMYRGGFTVAALASMLVVLELRTSPQGPLARALSFAPAVAIGRISYGLYLWHWPVFLALAPQITGLNEPVTLAARFGATFVIAGISWFVIERPPLAWKRRWS